MICLMGTCIIVSCYADTFDLKIPGSSVPSSAPWHRINGIVGVRMRVDSGKVVTVKPLANENLEILYQQLQSSDPLAESFVIARSMPSGEMRVIYRYDTMGPEAADYFEGEPGEDIDLKFLTPNNTLPVECTFHAVLNKDFVGIPFTTNLAKPNDSRSHYNVDRRR